MTEHRETPPDGLGRVIATEVLKPPPVTGMKPIVRMTLPESFNAPYPTITMDADIARSLGENLTIAADEILGAKPITCDGEAADDCEIAMTPESQGWTASNVEGRLVLCCAPCTEWWIVEDQARALLS